MRDDWIEYLKNFQQRQHQNQRMMNAKGIQICVYEL